MQEKTTTKYYKLKVELLKFCKKELSELILTLSEWEALNFNIDALKETKQQIEIRSTYSIEGSNNCIYKSNGSIWSFDEKHDIFQMINRNWDKLPALVSMVDEFGLYCFMEKGNSYDFTNWFNKIRE